MIWARMLAYITGTVDQELLLRNEYLAAENRILRAQIKARLLLSDAEKGTLAEIAHRLGRKALEELSAVTKPDTLLAWCRKLIASKFDGSKFRKSWGPNVRLARSIHCRPSAARYSGQGGVGAPKNDRIEKTCQHSAMKHPKQNKPPPQTHPSALAVPSYHRILVKHGLIEKTLSIPDAYEVFLRVGADPEVQKLRRKVARGNKMKHVPVLYLATAMALQGMTKQELEALKLRIKEKRV